MKVGRAKNQSQTTRRKDLRRRRIGRRRNKAHRCGAGRKIETRRGGRFWPRGNRWRSRQRRSSRDPDKIDHRSAPDAAVFRWRKIGLVEEREFSGRRPESAIGDRASSARRAGRNDRWWLWTRNHVSPQRDRS